MRAHPMLCAAAAAASILPATLAAQAVRVTLADTSVGAALAHVFVSLVPAPGAAPVDQGLTSAAGVRVLRASTDGRYLVVVRRVGYAPERFGPYALAAGTTVEARLPLVGRRVQLQAVTRADQARCGAPAAGAEGGDALLALWDALRAALETSAQARDENAVAIETRTFERRLTLDGKTSRQSANVAWTRVADTRPFTSVLRDNVYVVGSGAGEAEWRGPDERTLLSEAFVQGHCFTRVVGADATAGLVGLRFEPVRGAHPDIAGTLWLDPASAELRHVEYRYVRVDYGRMQVPAAFLRDRIDAGHPAPGGRIDFTRLPSNAWIVSRWALRTPRLVRGFSGATVGGLTEVGAEARLALGVQPTDVAGVARGVVWDSLHARPLAGALVFGPGGRSATSDAQGRWTLDSLPSGRARFTVAHATLDSLGLYDVAGEADVGGAAPEIRLATPSLATLTRELCPVDAATPAHGPGMVYGVTRDARGAAPEGVRVEASWTQLPDARGVRAGDAAVTVGRAAPPDAKGAFVVCGLPTDVELRVRVVSSAGRTQSVPVWLAPERPLAHLELASPAAGAALTAALRGAVRDSAGRPIVGATVRVIGDEGDGPSTRAGEDGTYRLGGLSAGAPRIEVTAVGHVPETREVTLRADATATLDVVMRRGVALAASVTTAKFTERFFSEIEARRLRGVGTIRTHEQLATYPQLSSTLADIPGVRVQHSGGRWIVRYMRLNPLSGCEPQIYLDGTLLNPQGPDGQQPGGTAATDFLGALAPTDVAAMEVYQNGALAPPQYVTGMNMCGVLLVWTKSYARMPVQRAP
ncbi:MAG: carboxypeptidase regulatory-like domain-containing protein [Gemmatirosa sp.]